MKRIFVGGIGRSGTTITLSALSFHPKLYGIPIETKFLVEADGFYDLFQALTSDYSTANTPLAVGRFLDLMKNKVTGLEPSSFTEQARLSTSFLDRYEMALNCLAETIGYRRYFQNRDHVLIAFRAFLDQTFDRLARISNKTGWAEKTPANFWRIEFLRELCPGSYFVHCLRDPRGILASLMTKGWIDSDPLGAAIQFEAMLAALVEKRRGYLSDSRWHEIRLEELESHHTIESVLNGLAQKLDLDPFSGFAIESVAEKIAIYHKSKIHAVSEKHFTREQALVVNQILLPWIIELGYSPAFPEEFILDEGVQQSADETVLSSNEVSK